MDKQEFIKSFLKYADQISAYSGFYKLSKFGIYTGVEKYISAKFPGVQIPPYDAVRNKSIQVILEDIWDRNKHLITAYSTSNNTSRSPYTSETSQKTTKAFVSPSRPAYSTQPKSLPSQMTHDKEGVISSYNGVIDTLTNIVTSLRETNLSKPELRTIKTQILSKLQEYINSAIIEKKFILQNTSWDKLVIGFFGETNAGKSTIIESLRILLRSSQNSYSRGQDGAIVGDGRHDFTKDYHEYSLDINGKPFVLIDVPGIEGNEKIYQDRIGEALRKAHVIFYVNGHNKTVDRGTASKIKSYMSDGVTVTALYNVRGNAENYEWPEDRKSLITPQVKTVLNGLDREFQNLIGNKYLKSIPVQGLLAMCAQAEFVASRSDLKNKQRSLINSFGEDFGANPQRAKEAIIRFSNINALIQLIQVKSNAFKEEIFKANMIKLEAFGRKAFQEFISVINDNNHRFTGYQSQVDSFIRLNKSILDDTQSSFSKELTSKLNRILQDLKRNMLDHIEHGNYTEVDRCVKQCERDVETTAKSLCDKYQKEIGLDINNRIKNLSNIPGFQATSSTAISASSFKMTINIDAIKDEDDISFGDVFKTLTNTGGGAATGAAIGLLFGPVGALIGGIIGGAGGLVSGTVGAAEEQTRRAKQKAIELIDKKASTFKKFSEDTSKSFNQALSNMVYKVNSSAATQISEIKDFNTKVEAAKNRLNSELSKIRQHAK